MPLLLRTSAQDAAYVAQALQLIELATIFAQINMFEECLLVLVTASASLEMTLQPSRSWATGMYARVRTRASVFCRLCCLDAEL